MRVASFAIALVIAASVSLAGQPVLKSFPVSLKVVDAPLSEVLDLVGKIGGLEIQLDDAVPQEVRDRKIGHIVFRDADLESVLTFLTSRSGLIFEIINEKTIYIRAQR